MKVVIKVKKQRNPLVCLVMFRKAGSHTKSNKAMRKQINADVRKALKHDME